jgi:2-polyprenyl-3-methyl-5-hydroxy-6-metoxy-1,4-benzoquinol methylase
VPSIDKKAEASDVMGKSDYEENMSADAPNDIQWFRCLDCNTVYQMWVYPRREAPYSEEQGKRSDDPYFIDRVKNDVISVLGETKDKSIIDVGCGTGWLSEILKKEGQYKRVVATDLPNRVIKVKDPAIEIYNYDFEITGIPEELKLQFDYVVNWQVIEHVKYPDTWFRLMSDLLVKGGLLFLTYCAEHMVTKSSKAEWRYSSAQGLMLVAGERFRLIRSKGRHLILERK